MSKKFKYPLLDNAFSPQDLQKGINVLRSGKITMSGITKKFEKPSVIFVITTKTYL